jgi:diguanylate cyclase (GGDEF)-like protein
MLQLQNLILEMVARGDALETTIDRLCVAIDASVDDAFCSVVIVDRDGLLHPLAGRGVPDELAALIDGRVIGPNVGSCGSAIYYREPVAVTDIAHDPRWEDYRDPALAAGMVACWSSPILGGDGRALGAFAFYYTDHRGPTDEEARLVAASVHLCAIAIERHERTLERERARHTDDLTGLGNRAGFDAMLSHMSCSRPGEWALLIIDLDNLKTINDTFGHHAGDCLLQVTAERLAEVAAGDAVFRLGGDEFAVLVQSPKALDDLGAASARILDWLGEVANCGGYQIYPKASIGGAEVMQGDSSATVRQNADLALYHAKETGPGGFVHYRPELGTTITRRLGAIRELELALGENRIDAHYQPVISLEGNRVWGFEALCRLTKPDSTILTASAFHEATADASVAVSLTRRMLGLVAKDMARWRHLGLEVPYVSVNITSADFHRGMLEEEVCALFAQAQAPLERLVLEVTESVHIGRRDHVVARTIASLRARGLRIALDDFGTGFASLTHLLAVPVDVIKIDRAFVERLSPDGPGLAIIEGLVGISAKLGITVVVEGVESDEQADLLRRIGCRFGQGYFFSPAVDRDVATEWIRSAVRLPPPALAS